MNRNRNLTSCRTMLLWVVYIQNRGKLFFIVVSIVSIIMAVFVSITFGIIVECFDNTTMYQMLIVAFVVDINIDITFVIANMIKDSTGPVHSGRPRSKIPIQEQDNMSMLIICNVSSVCQQHLPGAIYIRTLIFCTVRRI